MAEEGTDSAKSTIALFADLAASGINARKIKEFIEFTNEAFRSGYGPPQPRTGVINPAKLARQIHYYALVITKEGQTMEGTHARPHWTQVAEEYKEFCRKVGVDLGLPNVVDDEDLATLLTTNRQGSRKSNYYSGLALFLVDLHERGKMSSDFMRFALPSSETSFLDELRDHLRSAAQRIVQGVDLPPTSSDDTSEVRVHFYVNVAKMRELERFHGYFREDADSCAHFICYRARMSDPRELMKTFIAIKPPEAKKPDTLPASNAFNFVHVYCPPDTDIRNRISMGRVLPLDEGLYLVGGQRHRTERRTPFKTLKVIALPWTVVNRRDPLLPGLVMSANNDLHHIVSRVAIRATPIRHSDGLRLGNVKLSDLASDLAEDRALELECLSDRKADDDAFKRYGLSKVTGAEGPSVPRFLGDLLKFTNNSPTQWDLRARYERKGPAKESGVRALTHTSVQQELERIFGSESDGKFWDAADAPFDFWNSIRFGPLPRR